jgi:hypothetical protein
MPPTTPPPGARVDELEQQAVHANHDQDQRHAGIGDHRQQARAPVRQVLDHSGSDGVQLYGLAGGNQELWPSSWRSSSGRSLATWSITSGAGPRWPTG